MGCGNSQDFATFCSLLRVHTYMKINKARKKFLPQIICTYALQLALLEAKLGGVDDSCEHCQLNKNVLLFQVKGIYLLSWIDRYGDNHTIESLGQNVCNAKNPLWQVDTGIFDEKTLLPITGITYEGVEFEGQKTRIMVGPLTCLPNENQYDLRQHLETIEQKTDGTIENMTAFEIRLDILEHNNTKQNENIQKLHHEETEQISKIAVNEAKITTLEQMDIRQKEEIQKLADHKDRIKDLEENDVKQDGDIQNLQNMYRDEKTEQIKKIVNHESRINSLEQTDILQNEQIETLDVHKNRISDLEENDVKQNGDIQSLQSISHDEITDQLEKIANHESRIDTLEKNDLEQKEILDLIPKCPSGKMFKVIEEKCYAFENVRRNFQATQARCGQIFGNNAGGKIIEPRSDQVLREVLKYAKTAWDGANPATWMGITDESSEGNFAYPSDGQSHKLSWTFMTSINSNSRSTNCLLIHHSYLDLKKMHHWACSANLAAICEWVI